mgnify:CR=1 FL=1
MPFTTFHLIAGTSIKSVFPKYFSWSTFALTNIFIDFEVLYFLFVTGIPSHKFFHTIIGATLIAIFVAAFCKPICEFGLRLWNKTLRMEKFSWFKTNVKLTRFSAWSGAFIGAYSQLLLDSIMHRDMSPFSPFTDYNSFQRVISIQTLHDVCFGLLVFGFIIYFLKKCYGTFKIFFKKNN